MSDIKIVIEKLMARLDKLKEGRVSIRKRKNKYIIDTTITESLTKDGDDLKYS